MYNGLPVNVVNMIYFIRGLPEVPPYIGAVPQNTTPQKILNLQNHDLNNPQWLSKVVEHGKYPPDFYGLDAAQIILLGSHYKIDYTHHLNTIPQELRDWSIFQLVLERKDYRPRIFLQAIREAINTRYFLPHHYQSWTYQEKQKNLRLLSQQPEHTLVQLVISELSLPHVSTLDLLETFSQGYLGSQDIRRYLSDLRSSPNRQFKERLENIENSPWKIMIEFLYPTMVISGTLDYTWKYPLDIHPLEVVLLNNLKYTPREFLYIFGIICPVKEQGDVTEYMWEHLRNSLISMFSRSSEEDSEEDRDLEEGLENIGDLEIPLLFGGIVGRNFFMETLIDRLDDTPGFFYPTDRRASTNQETSEGFSVLDDQLFLLAYGTFREFTCYTLEELRTLILSGNSEIFSPEDVETLEELLQEFPLPMFLGGGV